MNILKRSCVKSGFSLIEVCLAMLIVGSGILLLVGLFPAGLKEAEYSVADTQVAFFSDFVLSGLHANASSITNWADWNDTGQFEIKMLDGFAPYAITTTPAGNNPEDIAEEITFPFGSDVKFRYTLNIGTVSGHPNLRYAELNVSAGEHGWMGSWFFTEFFYSGMQ